MMSHFADSERPASGTNEADDDFMSDSLSIALLSGGLDSATAAALALKDGNRVIGLSFDYGQRHRRELQAAERIAHQLGLEDHHCIEVNLSA